MACSSPTITGRAVAVRHEVHRGADVRHQHEQTPCTVTFYWLTVSAIFALGTAFGDFTATAAGFGYFDSGLLFVALFAVPGVLRLLGAPATATFWWAYILTRSLGASSADWLALQPIRVGLDLGYLPISAVGTALIAIGVCALQLVSRRRAWEHS
jgi:uncharacterized membrane-anchored protein